MGQKSTVIVPSAPASVTRPSERRLGKRLKRIVGAVVVLILGVQWLTVVLRPQQEDETPLPTTPERIILPHPLPPLPHLQKLPVMEPPNSAKNASFLPQSSAPMPESKTTHDQEDPSPIFVDEDPRFDVQELYAAFNTSDDAQEKVRIYSKIQKRIQAYTEHLKKQDMRQELLAFFLFLQILEPNDPQYAIRVGIAYMALGDYQSASLSVFAHRDNLFWGEEARQIIRAATQQSSTIKNHGHDTVVPLLAQNNGFLVDARLNDETNVRLMLDTGATRTVVNRDFLESSDVLVTLSNEQQKLLTANGPILASLVIFNNITLHDRRITDLKVAVLDDSPFVGFDGLLGMDFLGNYRFSIEPDKKRLILSDK